jgi:DNA-binding GntR family transcriptional regulator
MPDPWYDKGMVLCTYEREEIVNMNLQAMKRQAVPLHAEVAEVLRHQILSGELATGTRLPAVRELTEQLGVAQIVKGPEGRYFRSMKRIHAKSGKPFCQVEIMLDDSVFEQAPDRFTKEIVVSVLKDLGVEIQNARQKITISYADFAMASALDIKVNSAVFRVVREFLDGAGQLIYSATLFYPGDLLELDMAFSTD